jgi:ABC-type phosphate/phosphonate transport system substrate-binding protein
LKPLALAVNGQSYSMAFLLTRHDNPHKDFASVQGQSLTLATKSQPFLHLFLERQSALYGKSTATFFSKISFADNVEDALDDVVDGVVQVAVVDLAARDAYKRRKPGRYKQLGVVGQSPPFPAAVVAYHAGALEESTLNHIQQRLLDTCRNEKGRTMLTLFRLTGFETVPANFDRILAETLKAYPAGDNDFKSSLVDLPGQTR